MAHGWPVHAFVVCVCPFVFPFEKKYFLVRKKIFDSRKKIQWSSDEFNNISRNIVHMDDLKDVLKMDNCNTMKI